MYRYAGCRWPYPHRLTGDGYQVLMAGMRLFEVAPKEPQIWTGEEDTFLIEMYRKCKPISYITDMLERTEDGVKAHVVCLIKQGKLEQRHNIQVRRSQQRRAFIQRHFRERGIDYCMRHLGLARNTVRTYAQQLWSLPHAGGEFWTEQEKEFLRTHYRDKNFEYCAHKLGRSCQAIRYKTYDMGLVQSRHKVA